MGFDLTQEQTALQDMARKFAANEIRPRAVECDHAGTFPEDIIEKAFGLGLMSGYIPEEYGGLGLKALDTCIIEEELAWGCSGIATSMTCNGLALTPILVAGTEDQKKRFVAPFAEKLQYASFCLTEPGAGSDAGGIATTAKKEGDHYLLNGRKCFITNGSYASQYTVFASTDRSKGHKGLSAFVVPRSLPGVSVGKKEDKMGQRASDTADVLFEDVKVPVENLLGKEGEGFKVAMITLDYARPTVAAMGVGVARAAFELAMQYSKERTQFGVPIAMNQAIHFLLADMAMDIEAARLLTYKGAWILDEGKRNTKESSFAKAFAADLAMRVTTDAVQIFGGYGYMRDYPVEKLMRDAKLLQIYEGTSQIQRMVIAKEIMMR
ncbi:MAG: acyl-CoA dehydrogenase family protein [Deltaproteobacteria bacterium]|nr:acyl-CoA dehydrogenase family protein [Deltaproteobacteria bacterium]MDH3383887.1 acyl-CoA dehydrogenase family protein [Deltaproteobacteria bacterium]